MKTKIYIKLTPPAPAVPPLASSVAPSIQVLRDAQLALASSRLECPPAQQVLWDSHQQAIAALEHPPVIGYVIQALDPDTNLWRDLSQAEMERGLSNSAKNWRRVYLGSPVIFDEHHEFQKYKSQRGEAAGYIGDGLYSYSQPEWDAWSHRASLAPPSSSNARPLDVEILAETGSTHVTVRDGNTVVYDQVHKDMQIDAPVAQERGLPVVLAVFLILTMAGVMYSVSRLTASPPVSKESRTPPAHDQTQGYYQPDYPEPRPSLSQ